jgi:uncharacterized HAD superfamily protein
MKDNKTTVKEIIMNEQEKRDNKEFLTAKGGGLRFNKGKLRYDLVEPRAYRDFVEVLTDGANKYYDRSWELGFSWTSVLASLKRHIAAIEMGEDYDPESGRLHAAHAACNIHFLNAFYYTFPQGDDRPKRFLNMPKIGLDIDGVLADFTSSWHKLYPDTEMITSWYFDRQMRKRFEKMREEGTLDDFYLNLDAMEKPEDLLVEPHCYITSRPVSLEITQKWLDEKGFPARPVYSIDIMKSKVDVAKEAGIDIFIDDSFDNFVDLNNNGIFTYLYTAPWNVKYNVGHMRLNSLSEIPSLR